MRLNVSILSKLGEPRDYVKYVKIGVVLKNGSHPKNDITPD